MRPSRSPAVWRCSSPTKWTPACDRSSSERERVFGDACGHSPSTSFRAVPTSFSSGRESKPGRQVWQELLDRSILIRDCSGWPRLADCLRVTIGTPEENDEFLRAMAEIVQ